MGCPLSSRTASHSPRQSGRTLYGLTVQLMSGRPALRPRSGHTLPKKPGRVAGTLPVHSAAHINATFREGSDPAFASATFRRKRWRNTRRDRGVSPHPDGRPMVHVTPHQNTPSSLRALPGLTKWEGGKRPVSPPRSSGGRRVGPEGSLARSAAQLRSGPTLHATLESPQRRRYRNISRISTVPASPRRTPPPDSPSI